MLVEPKAQSMLRREAQALALLQLDSTADLLGQGEDDQGPYVIETRLPGVTLREMVAGYRERRSVVPPNVVRLVMERSFLALAELHDAHGDEGRLELSHGDLAPDHVLVGADGRVSFVDFGQARWRGMVEAAEEGELGSLPYVAPELARGEHQADQSCDVFALAGSIAYLALGREPCRGTTPAARLVEASERGLDVAALSARADLDGTVTDALMAALRFDRAARLRQAADVLRRLRRG
jgi:serine/threonine-protein kinase